MKRPTDTEVTAEAENAVNKYLPAASCDFNYDRSDMRHAFVVGYIEGQAAQTAEINRLKAVQAELVEALEYYAEKDRFYDIGSGFKDYRSTVWDDGVIARAALEKVRKAGGANADQT